MNIKPASQLRAERPNKHLLGKAVEVEVEKMMKHIEYAYKAGHTETVFWVNDVHFDENDNVCDKHKTGVKVKWTFEQKELEPLVRRVFEENGYSFKYSTTLTGLRSWFICW